MTAILGPAPKLKKVKQQISPCPLKKSHTSPKIFQYMALLLLEWNAWGRCSQWVAVARERRTNEERRWIKMEGGGRLDLTLGVGQEAVDRRDCWARGDSEGVVLREAVSRGNTWTPREIMESGIYGSKQRRLKVITYRTYSATPTKNKCNFTEKRIWPVGLVAFPLFSNMQNIHAVLYETCGRTIFIFIPRLTHLKHGRSTSFGNICWIKLIFSVLIMAS